MKCLLNYYVYQGDVLKFKYYMTINAVADSI